MYKDKDGKLHMCSAICTHMGAQVWSEAAHLFNSAHGSCGAPGMWSDSLNMICASKALVAWLAWSEGSGLLRQVEWNNNEKTFDCPNHGSHFDRYGRCIQGPASTDLKPL